MPEVFYDPFTNKATTEGYDSPTLPARKVTLKAGQEVLFDRDNINEETKKPEAIITGSYHKINYTVYGADAELAIDPEITILNEKGYTNADITSDTASFPAAPPRKQKTALRNTACPKHTEPSQQT